VAGLLFAFECRLGLGFPWVFNAGDAWKGEYLGLKLAEGGPKPGRTGLGACIVTSSSPLTWGDWNLWTISLLATLGTRRCRESGESERKGGLEEVEAGVGVTEVDINWSPLWEIEGTLTLPVVENLGFVEIDEPEPCDDSDVGEFSTLRGYETEATRVLETNVRWPRPVAELGVIGSPVVDVFALGDGLVTLEVIRMDGVGLG
jgi:hypothetical protein